MTLPQARPEYFQEQRGVLAVATLLNEMGLIWRSTPNADVGIDGQIEFVDDQGECTGYIVAAQVKSGPSFVKVAGDEITFCPDAKHVGYWTQFPLPVILLLYEPATAKLYWCDARQWLRSAKGSPIRIPLKNTLNGSTKRELFQTVGPLGATLLPLDRLVLHFANSGSSLPGFRISFLDMFVIGLTDMCRKLFFSMDLVMEIVEYRARQAKTGFVVGPAEQSALDAYIRCLCEQNIVRIDFADYLVDRDVRQLVPMLIAPLTERGEKLRTLLSMLDASGTFLHESLLALSDVSRHSLASRLDHLDTMQRAWRATIKRP